MKKTKAVSLTIMLAVLCSANSYAKPEYHALKAPEKQMREEQAKALAKNIDLSKVSDPAAKEALQVIVTALGLETKKVPGGKGLGS